MSPPPAPAAVARTQGATPLPLRLPPAPRRVSGPHRHPRAAGARPQSATSPFIKVVDHPWLDRLIRGRTWIAIVAVALLGIVAMQVALLRLGAQIGNETSMVNALVAQNETAQAAIGQLEASHHVGSQAATLGMLYPQPAAETYLRAKARNARSAAHRMTSPSAAATAAANAHRQSFVPAVTTPPATTLATSTAALTGGATPATAGATSATGSTAATSAAGTTATGATSTSAATTTAAPQTPAGQGATGTSTPATTTPRTTPSTAVTASNGAATAPTSGP